MRSKTAFSLASLMLVPAGAYALGLGGIQLNSALNQPFNARIRLLGATPDELADLKVGLAGPEAFRRAGIERPFSLAKLRFKVEKSGKGTGYIEVTSHDPIQEPFLDFLLEVNWNKGRLYREYTVLLDPPNYGQGGAAAAGPAAAPASSPAGGVGGTPVPMHHEVHYPSAAAASTGSGAYTGGDTYGPTTATDTLWSIAETVRPDESVTVQQMMLALLKANPDAFNQDNVNALRKGAILHIPDKAAVQSVDPETALADVRKQYALWDQYRQNQAASPSERPSGAATSSGTKIGAGGAGAHEEGEAHLKLVSPEEGKEGASGKPGAPGGTSGDIQSLRDQLAVLNESLETQKQQNADLQSRLNEAEQLVGSLRHLIALKDDQLAALQAKLSGAGATSKTAPVAGQPAASGQQPAAAAPAQPPAAPSAQGKPAGQAPSQAEPAAPAEAKPAAPAPAAKPAQTPEPAYAPPKSMFDQAYDIVRGVVPESVLAVIPGGVLTVLAGLVLIVLLLIALIARLVRAQREKANTAAMAAAMAPAPPEAPAEQGGPAAEASTEEPGEAANLEETVTALGGISEEEPATEVAPPREAASDVFEEPEEDPLAEVNVYLAYERFDQAEELVKQAIAREPDQPKYRLRLLEVYYSANDKAKYEAAARELHDAVGGEGPLWDSALAMWHELSPDRALFEAGAPQPGEAEEAGRAAKQFLDITSEEAAASEEEIESTDTISPPGGRDDALDFEFPGDEAEEQGGVLDITAAASEPADSDKDFLDLSGTVEEGGKGEDEDVLDITAGEGSKDEDLLDVTVTGEGLSDKENDSLLDVTAAGGREDLDQDLLDVTGGHGGSEEEGSTETLDLTAGGEGSAAAAGEDEHVTDFDLGGKGAKPAEGTGGEEPTEVFSIDTGTTEEGAAGESPLDFDLGEQGGNEAGPDNVDAIPERGEEPTDAAHKPLEFDTGGESAEVAGIEAGRGDEETAAAEFGGDENALDFNLGEHGAAEEGPEVLDITAGEGAEPPHAEGADENIIEFDVGGLSAGPEEEQAGAAEEAPYGLGEPQEGGAETRDESSLEIDLSDFGDLENEGTVELGHGERSDKEPPTAAGGEEPSPSKPLSDLGIDEEDEDATRLFLDEEGTPTVDISQFTGTEESASGGPAATGEAQSKADEFDLDLDIEAPEDTREHLTTVEFEPDSPGESDTGEDTVAMPRSPDAEEQSEEDEVDTKLNLAKAYIELGDADGARAILDEVANVGTDDQRNEASELRRQMDS